MSEIFRSLVGNPYNEFSQPQGAGDGWPEVDAKTGLCTGKWASIHDVGVTLHVRDDSDPKFPWRELVWHDQFEPIENLPEDWESHDWEKHQSDGVVLSYNNPPDSYDDGILIEMTPDDMATGKALYAAAVGRWDIDPDPAALNAYRDWLSDHVAPDVEEEQQRQDASLTVDVDENGDIV